MDAKNKLKEETSKTIFSMIVPMKLLSVQTKAVDMCFKMAVMYDQKGIK